MKHIFFDLDGTLCESRLEASEKMNHLLSALNRSSEYSIAIVSGAKLEVARSQIYIPNVLYMSQNGNDVWRRDICLWSYAFDNDDIKNGIYRHINLLLHESGVIRNNDMLEDRGSQISLSFVGHHAPIEEKKKFDPDRKKRTDLLTRFPFSNAVIGGTTSIDYIPHTKGENIQHYIDILDASPTDCIYIGDALQGFGNDATVCGIIPTFEVRGPKDTMKFIEGLLRQ